MPLYHFNVEDGRKFPDDQGTELANLAAARTEALRFAAELLDEAEKGFWDGDEWSVIVTDQDKVTLFTLKFSGTDAPAIKAA